MPLFPFVLHLTLAIVAACVASHPNTFSVRFTTPPLLFLILTHSFPITTFSSLNDTLGFHPKTNPSFDVPPSSFPSSFPSSSRLTCQTAATQPQRASRVRRSRPARRARHALTIPMPRRTSRRSRMPPTLLTAWTPFPSHGASLLAFLHSLLLSSNLPHFLPLGFHPSQTTELVGLLPIFISYFG